jgi:hypothetical protein
VASEVVDAVDAPAEHVEAHRAHADVGQPGDLGVGMIVRDLRHPHPARAEARQHILQIGLVVRLERPRDDRAGLDAQRPGFGEIGFERKGRGHVALIRHDREAMVDDVTMAVEQAAPAVRHVSPSVPTHGIVRHEEARP